MSIGKAQASALAEDFFDSLGGSKDNVRLTETISELELIAAEFIEDAQKNLQQSNSIASGNLSESLEASEPILMPGVVKIEISMNDYGLFVNSGVKGTKSGSSTAGYSFKNAFPSKKMVLSIKDWIGKGKASISNVKKTYGKIEGKNKSISALSSAYAVATSVKQHGLKPTGFIDKAIQTTQAKVEDRLGAALEIDIIRSITQ